MAKPDKLWGIKSADQYAADVISGQIPACRYVKLACERYFKDKADATKGHSEWEFKPKLAQDVIDYASYLPNIKGPMAGKPLQVMGWQAFVIVNLMGFVERGTQTRRFRQGVVFVPRGNGKTTFAAPIALYLSFMEGEGGAEGYAAAVTRDQARILFDTAKNMVKASTGLHQTAAVEISANSIYQTRTASKFVPVSSDAKALDGLNVAVAVCDEIGSHKTSHVYDILLTAMGKRAQPMLLSISTATGNNTGIGKQLWDYGVRVLEGAQTDDRLFSLIYTIDEGDDPWDEASWIKANPSWGQAVQPDAVRGIMRQARNNPAQEAAAMTRHLNVWTGADEALFSMRAWRSCLDSELTLDSLEGEECHIGLDLASKTDLAALSLVFPARANEMQLSYKVFSRCYLNDAAVLEARNPSYPAWAAENYLTVTEGNETDFSRIEEDLLEFCKRFRVISVAYDPWAATQFSQRMRDRGVPMVEFAARTANFSEPTKELDAAMRGGRILHDGNPVLEWCIGNVVGRYDARANVYPKKSRPEQKIDAAIALVMGISRALASFEGPSVYESRGLLVV